MASSGFFTSSPALNFRGIPFILGQFDIRKVNISHGLKLLALQTMIGKTVNTSFTDILFFQTPAFALARVFPLGSQSAKEPAYDLRTLNSSLSCKHVGQLRMDPRMLGLSPLRQPGHPGWQVWRWAGEAESCGMLGVVSRINSRVDTKVPVTGG